MNYFTFDKNRVINFSDAVFSIVMTLLILEVGVPTIRELADSSYSEVLRRRIPDFIGLLVSFLVSALYWIGHMRLMRYVSTVSERFVWLNIFFLLSIVLLPFSTAMYVNGFDLSGPFIFYCLNLIVIGAFSFFMLRYVYRKEQEQTGLSRTLYLWNRNRGFNVILIWTLAACLAPWSIWLSRFIFLLLFVIQALMDRYYKKRLRLQEMS